MKLKKINESRWFTGDDESMLYKLTNVKVGEEIYEISKDEEIYNNGPISEKIKKYYHSELIEYKFKAYKRENSDIEIVKKWFKSKNSTTVEFLQNCNNSILNKPKDWFDIKYLQKMLNKLYKRSKKKIGVQYRTNFKDIDMENLTLDTLVFYKKVFGKDTFFFNNSFTDNNPNTIRQRNYLLLIKSKEKDNKTVLIEYNGNLKFGINGLNMGVFNLDFNFDSNGEKISDKYLNSIDIKNNTPNDVFYNIRLPIIYTNYCDLVKNAKNLNFDFKNLNIDSKFVKSYLIVLEFYKKYLDADYEKLKEFFEILINKDIPRIFNSLDKKNYFEFYKEIDTEKLIKCWNKLTKNGGGDLNNIISNLFFYLECLKLIAPVKHEKSGNIKNLYEDYRFINSASKIYFNDFFYIMSFFRMNFKFPEDLEPEITEPIRKVTKKKKTGKIPFVVPKIPEGIPEKIYNIECMIVGFTNFSLMLYYTTNKNIYIQTNQWKKIEKDGKLIYVNINNVKIKDLEDYDEKIYNCFKYMCEAYMVKDFPDFYLNYLELPEYVEDFLIKKNNIDFEDYNQVLEPIKSPTKNIPTKNIPTKNIPTKNIPTKNPTKTKKKVKIQPPGEKTAKLVGTYDLFLQGPNEKIITVSPGKVSSEENKKKVKEFKKEYEKGDIKFETGDLNDYYNRLHDHLITLENLKNVKSDINNYIKYNEYMEFIKTLNIDKIKRVFLLESVSVTGLANDCLHEILTNKEVFLYDNDFYFKKYNIIYHLYAIYNMKSDLKTISKDELVKIFTN